MIGHQYEWQLSHNEVRAIKENFPESEWTEEQKALVKTLEDKEANKAGFLAQGNPPKKPFTFKIRRRD